MSEIGEILRDTQAAWLREKARADALAVEVERLTKALRLFTGNPYVRGYCIACGGPKSLDDHADNCRYGIASLALRPTHNTAAESRKGER